MNNIYIIPTRQKPFTLPILKSRLSNYLDKEVYIEKRGVIDNDSELYDLRDVIDVGEECEFRFYKEEWSSSFIGSILSYGSRHYSDDKLSKVFKHNLNIGFIIQITGGPEPLDDLEVEQIYFGLIKMMTELFEGMIFIDPEGCLYNNDYYNRFKKRLYTFEDFENENRFSSP